MNDQTPNQTKPILGSSNRVRVHAAHDREHGCHESFILYRGCTHFPWVVISSPVFGWLTSPFRHTGQAQSHFLWCKARRSLQDFLMASSSLQCTRWGFTGGVSPEPPRAPSCAVWFSGESTPLPTRSQLGEYVESPLYPLHRLVRQTSIYHILCQVVSI
jgi:hypothetical protein